MKRAVIYVVVGLVIVYGGLRWGPDLIGGADTEDGDDSGISGALDVLPWVGLALLAYLVIVGLIELSRRRSQRG